MDTMVDPWVQASMHYILSELHFNILISNPFPTIVQMEHMAGKVLEGWTTELCEEDLKDDPVVYNPIFARLVRNLFQTVKVLMFITIGSFLSPTISRLIEDKSSTCCSLYV